MKKWVLHTALIFPMMAGLVGTCSFHSEASHPVQINHSTTSADDVIHNLRSLFDRPYKEVTRADLDQFFNVDKYLNKNRDRFTEKEREEIKKESEKFKYEVMKTHESRKYFSNSFTLGSEGNGSWINEWPLIENPEGIPFLLPGVLERAIKKNHDTIVAQSTDLGTITVMKGKENIKRVYKELKSKKKNIKNI